MVERLFSLAKRVFSPHRRRLSTKTLEALLFLNQNRQLWNLSTVASVVNGRSEDAVSDEERTTAKEVKRSRIGKAVR